MIFFDLTSCMDYIGRNPLGIVRVEMKFADYALRHFGADRLTFCYFDRPSGKIRNLALQDAHWVLSQIGRPVERAATKPSGATPIATPAAPEVHSRAAFPIRMRVKNILKGLKASVVREFSDNPRVLGAVARIDALYRGLKCGQSNSTPILAAVSAPPPQIQCVEEDLDISWGKNDVFVTIGLIWDYLPLNKIYSLKKKLGFKVVGMIYDLVPYQVPEFCAGVPPSFFRAVTDLIWCADGILTISQQTRGDVLTFVEEFHLPRPKIMEVAYLGMDVGILQPGYVPSKEEIDVSRLTPGRFILQVGTMEARKNHALSINVWRMLSKEPFPELMPLVVIGAQGWGVSDILDTVRRDIRLVPKYFMQSGRVSDQTLLWLYANAYMTIYPSFYEGWGLPVSESLANGKFCLSGDNGALIEAGCGYAEALSPFDVVGWAHRLKWLMQHPDEVAQRNATIVREFHPATWEQRGAEFYDFVERVWEAAK